MSTRSERGQVLILTLTLLVLGAGLMVYKLITPASQDNKRDMITAAALAQAKAALIGFAVSVNVSPACAGSNCPRIGDLPCPDLNDDGSAEGSCGDAAGSNQAQRLGRLPWKTLGLPDLRDGDGQRLWYAVSNNFKNNTRTDCSSAGLAGCRNSDSRGTITVRNTAGTVINDGTNPDPYTPSGVIAVIFAPGAVLQRQGAASAQDRSCRGGSCNPAGDPAGVCTSVPLTLTPKCNPINYLDILTGVEDNAAFTDGSSADGFINGVIRDASDRNIVFVNDRLISITYNDLMPVLQRRVAKEVLNCLVDYAGDTRNNGRYPWAAPITDVTEPYADAYNTRFGRIPDVPFSFTQLGVAGGVADLSCTDPALCMRDSWTATCNITLGSWWTNWKEMVFYGLAEPSQPADPISYVPPAPKVPAPGACGGACPGPTCCLLVNPPSAAANKRIVVVVAGKRLTVAAYPTGNGQPRTTVANKQDATNYLEGTNDNTATSFTYEAQPITASFSDFLLYQ